MRGWLEGAESSPASNLSIPKEEKREHAEQAADGDPDHCRRGFHQARDDQAGDRQSVS